MTTPLSKTVSRKVRTSRGPRIVEFTPVGVVVREPRKRNPPPPVSYEAIEDLGLKSLAASNGHPIPKPRRRRRGSS